MLMLLAPVAVSALAITTRLVKQWKAGTDVRNNDTAVMMFVPTVTEWDVIETTNDVSKLRKTLVKGLERGELTKQVLNGKG